jgi:hypothetical protein
MNYPFEKDQPITQEFGENPGNYSRWNMKAHNGIDWGCPSGTNVLAAAAGTVERTDYDETGYGWYIQIKHPDGLTSVYAHLSQIRVQPRTEVKAGQLIGQSGSTGNSTGPHLHFEVRQQGQEGNGYHGAIDPKPLLDWPTEADELATAGMLRVLVTSLNVRQGPGVEERAICRVPYGTELRIAGEPVEDAEGKGTWVPVMLWVAREWEGHALTT